MLTPASKIRADFDRIAELSGEGWDHNSHYCVEKTGYSTMNHTHILPDPPQGSTIHTPMVYVKTQPKWEYKQLARNLAKEAAPTEDELTALGADGWELAGVLTDSPFAYFYFKRLKD